MTNSPPLLPHLFALSTQAFMLCCALSCDAPQGGLSDPTDDLLDVGTELDSSVLDQSLDQGLDQGLDLGENRDFSEPEAVDMSPPSPLDLGPDTGINPEFVLNEITLLPATEGLDLSGDGVPDNGLALLFSDPVVGGALGGDPNEFIARTVRRGELLLLLDFNRLDDLSDDDHLNLDIFLGRDSDDRRRNNFNGSHPFYVSCSSLDASGAPESQFLGAELRGGALSGAQGQFRFLVSFSDTEVLLQNAKIQGQMSPEGDVITSGLLGGAVSFTDLEEVVLNDPEIGPGFATLMLNFLRSKLDVDLDGDGSLDALSASFSFTAVRAVILRGEPCQE